MPTNEGRQVLELLAQGKIDADQAYRLLRALGDIREAGPPASPTPPSARSASPGADRPGGGSAGRTLHIRVVEGGRRKVNIAIPLAIARLGKVVAWKDRVRGQLLKFGVDLDDIVSEIDSGRVGPLLDIGDEDDRVLILIT